MSFLGTLSTSLDPEFNPASSWTLDDDLPRIVSDDWGNQRLSCWGLAQRARSEGQGILLDGRIFNAAELAERLGTGPLDQPTLLLHAYLKWGAEFPKYLEGEFAFALWDGRTRRILLGRDSTGYRPLFYMQRGADIRFAHEVRLLLAWPGTKIRPNETHVAQWLMLLPAGTNTTFFEDVFSVPPGHTLLFEKGGVVLNAVWQPENLPLLHLRDSREYADGLREVLERAIADRVQTATAVGTHLSGGLDSSSVATLAARCLKQQDRTLFAFTAVPAYPACVPGRFCDEGPHAASVAAMHPNVEHVLVRHGSHSTFSLIDRFNSAQQEPVFNPANYDWVYEICVQARERGIKTLLTGALGNFTISYDGHLALSSLVQQGQLFRAAQFARDLYRQGRRWRGIAHLSIRPLMPLWASYSADCIRRGFSHPPAESMIRPEFAKSHGLDFMARARLSHRLDSRSLRLLYVRRADPGPVMEAFRRLSGVSMSDPTMDKRVIEYCLSVPVEYFCEKGIPRSLIRNAMAGLLPEQVRTERLKGLQAADFAEHFRTERQESLAELARMRTVDLAARALDVPEMENMMHWSESQIEEHGASGYYWPKLMRALSLGRFLRRIEEGTLLSKQQQPISALAG